MDNPLSCFAIYQLKDNDNTEGFRFEGSEYLANNNIEIDNQNFNAIYTDTLSDKLKSFPHAAVCEQLYAKFNMDIPPDFEGHSLSIGDVIGLNVDGNISYHFVDRFGFKEVSFINPYPTATGRIEPIPDTDIKTTDFFEEVKNNPQPIFHALNQDKQALGKINTIIAICELHDQLADYHTYPELVALQSYCHDTWLKSDNASYEQIADFAVSAINENKITVFDLKEVKRSDFLYALDMENTAMLAKNNPLAATEMAIEENYNQIDGIIDNLPAKEEPTKRPSVLKALKEIAATSEKTTEKKQTELDR